MCVPTFSPPVLSEAPGLRQPRLAGDPFRSRIAGLDQAHESLEAEGAEGEVAHGAGRLGRVTLVPAVAANAVAEFRELLACDLHQLEPAVADEAPVALQAHREEPV